MNRLEEIKERLSYLPRELQDGGFSENSLEYGARLDIEYLLLEIDKIKAANPEFWILYDHFENKIAEKMKLKDENEIAIIALKSLNEQ